jgi:class 3 adenylate cyclase/tetratricopeptide (TPR) repeat protein
VAEKQIEARPRDVIFYRETGEQLLKTGSPLQAYDTLAEGLKHFPADVRLLQLSALSLARSGASELARQILERLASDRNDDEETLGLLARTYKDLAATSTDSSNRQQYLQKAFRCYFDAYAHSDGYWSGINAATTALLLNDKMQASDLAGRVRTQCLGGLETAPNGRERYWVLATLGEAALVLGEWSEAANWYSRAAAIGQDRLGNLVSTRRNARLIIRHLGRDGAAIEACFRIPRVAVFSGHLIDRPERSEPRFPARLEADVARAIRNRMKDADIGFAYASAACGGDILFLECLSEMGAELDIVLPYHRDQFVQDSVDIVPGADWPARFAGVLGRAAQVITASDQRMSGSAVPFEYAFRFVDGLAALRSDELDTELLCVAVWDGKAGDGPGGTASAVEHWRQVGRRVEIIHLAELQRGHPVQVAPPAAINVPPEIVKSDSLSTAFDARLVGLLFADARGFSALSEEQIPLFVEHFLGTLARELANPACAPILTNTWGDGLHLVFKNVLETGQCALRLSEAIRSIAWSERGLPSTLSLRIGLHAGPAYACMDPVTQRLNYLGSHVSRAARIEPITPPGEVYASGAFAALARAEGIQEFICAYVGQTPLAKGYGTWPTYVVHRHRPFGDGSDRTVARDAIAKVE